ncbi:MAG: hypothetical protein V3T77_11060 [Planctomycetota bacterium]
MISKQQFLDSVAHEVKVCKHIHSKLTPGQLDYKPGENTRTTLELLRYLTFCGAGPTRALVQDDWSPISRYQEAASSMSAEEFPEKMEAQLKEIHELLADVSEEDLQTREAPLPWGVREPLGASLVNLPLKFLASYRLQLFSYVKASGATQLSTYDAWLGMDKPEEK